MPNFLEINNQGIKCLEDGNYEEAAKLFKEAFDTIKSIVVARRTTTHPTPSSTSECKAETTPPRPLAVVNDSATECKGSKKRKLTTTSSEKTTTTTTAPIDDDDNLKRTKRQRKLDDNRASHVAPTGPQEFVCPKRNNNNNNSILLCRPLWLEPSNGSLKSTQNMYTSSILYNYAYTLQQAGMTHDDDEHRRKMFLRKSMDTYGNAMRLSIRGKCHMILWMSCHNMQQLLPQTDETPQDYTRKYQTLDNHKATVLRVMAKNLSCDDMCILVVNMLGVGGNERSDSPAGAA